MQTFSFSSQGVEQKYNIKCLGITTIFIHSSPIFMGSNVIGQINIIIKKSSFFIFCWESFAGKRLKSELKDISRDWVFFFVMLCQVFTAADFSCCLFVALSVFSFVFSEWNAAQSGWDQEIDSACAEYSTFFTFKNSWVAFALCFGSLFICTMKHRPINFAAFGWIWAESISLYTSELICLLSHHH